MGAWEEAPRGQKIGCFAILGVLALIVIVGVATAGGGGDSEPLTAEQTTTAAESTTTTAADVTVPTVMTMPEILSTTDCGALKETFEIAADMNIQLGPGTVFSDIALATQQRMTELACP